MTPREKIIEKILSLDDDYIEFADELAAEMFTTFVQNINVLDNLKNRYMFVDTGDKKINCKLEWWRIDTLEVDSIEEMEDGSMDFRGACGVEWFKNPLQIIIKTKDFNIYEVWAMDLHYDIEIAFIEKSKYVQRMERETYKISNQSYGNKYKFVFKGSV